MNRFFINNKSVIIESAVRNHTKWGNAPYSGILDDELFDAIYTAIVCSVFPAICILGVINNCLNLYAYLKIGLQDSVTVCFFCLSFSDLCFLLLMIRSHVSFYVAWSVPNLPVNMDDLTYIGAWYYRMFYDISVLTTTFVAAQRGCCVAFPFQFKGVFTRNRSIVVIVTIYVSMLAVYIPMFSKMTLAPDSNGNNTYMVLQFKPGWEQAMTVLDILNKIILVFSGQTIVLVSLIVISVGMWSSSRFRQASASHGNAHQGINHQHKTEKAQRNSIGEISRPVPATPTYNIRFTRKQRITTREKFDSGQKRQENPSNSKEKKVLKQVTLVSIFYVVCNTPQIMVSLVKHLVPSFDHNGVYTNMFWLAFAFVNVFEAVNASVNFYIYYQFNAKFRDAVRTSCNRCRRQSDSSIVVAASSLNSSSKAMSLATPS